MRRVLIIGLLGFIVFLGVFFVQRFSSNTNFVSSDKKVEVITDKSQKESPLVSVHLDFGDGKILTYNNIPAKTAFEALQKVTNQDSITLKTKQYDFGIFVESIGEKSNTKDLSWSFYVNGTLANKASDKYDLLSGDRVEWKYVKPIY
jgi:hypothetical protein